MRWVLESAIGGSLTTPSQVATDLIGNVYVADAGHGQVLMYAAGSGASATGVSIGTGLAAPTGVAVDGPGDVFIADSGSGSVFEVPFGPGGLNTAGQLKLMSGFGANLRLAADGLGNLYVADPANGRVVRLGNLGATAPGVLGQSETILTGGFTAPSEVAVDSKNNLFVIDGANLLELSGGLSAPTTLLNTLSNATGVAIDASGAVYVASTGGTVRIPYVNGALVPANQTAVASSVTNPTAVAIDNLGNAYLTDGTAGSIHLVSTSSTLNLGSLATTSSTATLPVTVTNQGNAPLTITGFTSTNSVDYVATDVSCIGTPLAAGGTCEFNVTFNPGPGEEGALTGKIGIQSNAANGPIVVNATGVGASLAKTLSSLTVGTTPEVVNTQVTVTVRPQSGGAVPTGQVTVSFTTVTGATATATGTLTNGSVTLTLSPVAAGSRNFTVSYIGDRVFEKSTATSTATVAKSAIASLALPVHPPTFLPMPQNVTYTPIVSTHVVTPVYSGDANNQGFTGQSTTFIAVRNPVVAIGSSQTTLTLAAGSSASANLTLTSMLGYGFAGKNQQLNDYNFPVSLSCSNLPPHTTCSFSYPNPDPQIPSAVDIPCSGTTAAADNCAIGLAMITINTNVPVGTTTSQMARPARVTFAVLFGFGMIGFFFRRSLDQRGRLLLILCLAILGGTLAVSITACSTTNLSPASVLTTPKGTYQVSVTAQQVGSQVITLPSGPITIYGSQNQVSLPFTISVTVQ